MTWVHNADTHPGRGHESRRGAAAAYGLWVCGTGSLGAVCDGGGTGAVSVGGAVGVVSVGVVVVSRWVLFCPLVESCSRLGCEPESFC